MKWPMVPFSNVAETVTGNTPPKKDPDNYGPGVPWVKPPDLDAWEPIINTSETLSPKGQKLARLLPEGTVMVCCIGSIGRVGIAGTNLASNQQINSLIFCPQIVPKFGYYYCRSISQVFKAAARKAVVPILNKSNFAKIKIPLPPLSEQQRIVEILDQAAALRKKRAEADAKAARILPALFYKMFGDPVTNPKGLQKTPIREIIVQIDRRNPNERPDEYFMYIDITGVNGEIGAIVETKRLVGSDAPSRARQIVKARDILISTVRPYLRATALVPDELDNQICSTGFCVLRPKEGFGYGFLYALSRLSWFTELLNIRARGASYPAVTDTDILNLKVPRPTDDAQLKVFDQRVCDIIGFQHSRREVYQRLEDLFVVLLHRAFTGDLTANWRKAHMKELLAEMEKQSKELENVA